jgi:hypothetical protein
MTTTRHRYTVTETDELARALDAAAERWPDEREARGRLLLHLVEEGYLAISRQQHDAIAADREAIERASGMLAGLYPPGYLEELREDWPE